MKQDAKVWLFKSIFAVLVFVTCFLYFKMAPETNSWLHKEQNLEGQYKIGKIELLLNGLDNVSVPITLNAIAPTRFFNTGSDRDANFDIAVKKFDITGINAGDIDIKIDMSYTDSNTSNYSVFYVFVPANTQNTNFLSGKYRDYLDEVFTGYSLDNNSQRKAAMNAINTSILNDNKGIMLAKDANQTLFYMLVWAEYDNIDGVMGTQFVNISYPIDVKAYSYQTYQ